MVSIKRLSLLAIALSQSDQVGASTTQEPVTAKKTSLSDLDKRFLQNEEVNS